MFTMDGGGDKQDTKPSAQSAQTSKATFTEEQVLERERKARSDALSEAGRYKAEAEKASKNAQAALDRLNRLEQERLDAELDANKDDPAEIKRIRAEQKARQLESELATERQAKTEYEQRIQAIELENKERNKTSLSQDIARKFNVDSEKLSNLAKFTDGSEKAIETLAEALPKNAKSFKPDSNRGVGGLLTLEDARNDFIKNPTPESWQRLQETKTK